MAAAGASDGSTDARRAAAERSDQLRADICRTREAAQHTGDRPPHARTYGFDPRINGAHKLLNQRAADLQGRTMPDFVPNSAGTPVIPVDGRALQRFEGHVAGTTNKLLIAMTALEKALKTC